MTNRIVIDTTTLVSSTLKPSGKPAEAVKLARERFETAVSLETLQEAERVFQKERFNQYISQDERLRFLEEFAEASTIYKPNYEVKACRDPTDDKFLSLAIACDATVILSSDKDLKDMRVFEGIEILSPTQFLQRELDREKADSRGDAADQILAGAAKIRQREVSESAGKALDDHDHSKGRERER